MIADMVEGVLDQLQRGGNLVKELFSSSRQGHAARRAVEQPDREPILQRGDGMTQG